MALSKPLPAVLSADAGRKAGCNGSPGLGSTMGETSVTEIDRTGEVEKPRSPVGRFGADKPLKLDAGVDLAPYQIAYQTYGTLNAQRSNAVLVCHALTGDQHVANVHPVTGKSGWWETMIGPGRPIDTERYFIVCPNVVGGC